MSNKIFAYKEAALESGQLSTGYTISWSGLSFKVGSKKENNEKEIIKNLSGVLKPGQCLAVLGASGCGKSTFLDTLSGRKQTSAVGGEVRVNGSTDFNIKQVSRYCTQEDALFGSLTVKETINFAAQFNLPQNTPPATITRIVDDLLLEFGLSGVGDTIIGTPLIKGCSGGQVRRVSVASQIVGMETGILFLDEPTSGLDSVAAYSVIEVVKKMAVAKNATVIATIHQPSTDTFNLFTHIMIMAKGEVIYFGEREGALGYFAGIGRPIPNHYNPSDVYLQMTNTDFLKEEVKEEGMKKVVELITAFKSSKEYADLTESITRQTSAEKLSTSSHDNGFFHQTAILTRRGFLNALKNPLSYWVRVAMYAGLAFLMGTTWLQMGLEQSQVTNRMISLNFSVAFLAFMAVAGIPAFLEERHVYLRERANNLYGVESYLISNFIVSVPFLFIIAVVFSLIGYFSMGLQMVASKFFIYLAFLLMMLIIAEAQVQFISVVLPIFVAALTITAFANGLWMVVNGFALIRISDIPPGWRYTFHYIDFQKYTFEAIMKNEMTGLVFQCAPAASALSTCACMIPAATNSNCTFTGEDVLAYYEHTNVRYYSWFLILVLLFFAFKLGTYAVLKFQRVQ